MKVEDKTKIKKRYGWIISIIVLLILAIIVYIPTDYYLESPGSVFPVSEFITTKQKKYENLNMVTVSVSRNPISIGQYLWSYTQKFDSRVSSRELLGNQSNSQYEELQNWYMETSQQNAVYYAAKKAKLKPKLSYFGVYVLAIQKNSSFKHKLQIGDTVLLLLKFYKRIKIVNQLSRRITNSLFSLECLLCNHIFNLSPKANMVKLKMLMQKYF